MKTVRARDLKLFERDDEEKLLGEIPRSNLGLIFIFFNAIFLTLLMLVLVYFVSSNEATMLDTLGLDEDFNLSGLVSAAMIFVIVLIFIGSIISGYVYKNSYIVLTDQKLVLINTKGIFARRVSQLSIGDVQDVSVDQNTMFSRLFNYGHINIETAGEQAHFTFSFADKPNDNAKFIVEAHEDNLKLYGN